MFIFLFFSILKNKYVLSNIKYKSNITQLKDEHIKCFQLKSMYIFLYKNNEIVEWVVFCCNISRGLG